MHMQTQVPPNKTDQVQPVDDGLGREIKWNMGKEEDEWLEDDDNLIKWEDNKLTASDRRILLAQWYCTAFYASLLGRCPPPPPPPRLAGRPPGSTPAAARSSQHTHV